MLSGGEKAVCACVSWMYDPLNLLILDELTPTTLTLHPASGLRRRLRHSTHAAVCFHDRYFVERFATRKKYLENGSPDRFYRLVQRVP